MTQMSFMSLRCSSSTSILSKWQSATIDFGWAEVLRPSIDFLTVLIFMSYWWSLKLCSMNPGFLVDAPGPYVDLNWPSPSSVFWLRMSFDCELDNAVFCEMFISEEAIPYLVKFRLRSGEDTSPPAVGCTLYSPGFILEPPSFWLPLTLPLFSSIYWKRSSRFSRSSGMSTPSDFAS